MKVLIEELHPISATVKRAVQKVVSQAGEEVLDDGSVKKSITEIVKKAAKKAVKEAIRA